MKRVITILEVYCGNIVKQKRGENVVEKIWDLRL